MAELPFNVRFEEAAPLDSASDRAEEKIADAIEAAIRAGWDAKRFREAAASAWVVELNNQANAAWAELVKK
jgi:D-aminopeptidase